MGARINDKVAAGVMLVAPDGRVLLLRRGPNDTSYPGHWNLPGGKCDAGEAPHDTAARECREETQLSPDTLTLVRQETTPRGWTYHTYMSRVPEAVEPQLLDGEHDDHVWADLNKLPRPMHPGLQRVLLEWRRRAQRSGANDGWEENEHSRDADGKFATSGSEHLSSSDKAEWFGEKGERKLPRAREDWVGSPIRPSKVPLYEMRRPGESVDANASKTNLMELDLDDLETIQGHVDPAKLRPWDAAKAPPIDVYKLNGKYVLGDGNHRAASAWAANAGKVKVRVLDLDKHQKLLKPKYRKNSANDSRNVTMDAQSVRTFDSAGHMRVASSPLTKANICEYYGREIPGCRELGLEPERRYKMYRDPKELEAAAPAFAGKPLLLVHAPAFAQDYPREVTVGSIGDDIAFDGEFIRGPLTVWDEEGIRYINTGQRRELSASYDYTPDMTPGSAGGQAYDGVMRNIKPNHVALVRKGRAGSDVLVADAKPEGRFALAKKLVMDAGWEESKHKRDDSGKFGSGGGGGAATTPKKDVNEGHVYAEAQRERGSTKHMTPEATQAYSDKRKSLAAAERKANQQRGAAYKRYAVLSEKLTEANNWTHKPLAGKEAEHKAAKEVMDKAQAIFLKAAAEYEAHVASSKKKPGANDSQEMLVMKKTNLPSRRALVTQGALTAYLLPLLAEDAEIDLAPALRGVTNKNFAKRVPKIVAAVEKMCEGKLAADADIGDVAEMLDALKGIKAEDPIPLGDPDPGAAAALAGQDDDPVVQGAEGDLPPSEPAEPDPTAPNPGLDQAAMVISKVLEFLQDKLSPDDLAAVTAICSEGGGPVDAEADAEDNDEPGTMPPANGKDNDMKDMVTKVAMDEAIKTAVAGAQQQATVDAIRIANEIVAARNDVEPWVGKVTLAFDSAEAVYRNALKMLNVPNAETLHADALRPILLARPKPSEIKTPLAMDGASIKSFGERFAGAGNIQRM